MLKLCINLDSRPDRWEQASIEFERAGLEVQRISAITGDNRPLAFNQSVYKAMEMARGQDLLLFEDDVVFQDWIYSPKAKCGLIEPSDCLTIHYGANIFGDWKMPEKYSEDYARLYNCWQSHATYYSKEAVEFILTNMNPSVIDEKNMIFDEWLRLNLLPLGRSYVHVPMIAYQRPSYSDIWRRDTDYTSCHLKGNEWLQKHCI